MKIPICQVNTISSSIISSFKVDPRNMLWYGPCRICQAGPERHVHGVSVWCSLQSYFV